MGCYERVMIAWLLLLLALPVQAAETLTGRVVGVHDGDTLTLLVERPPANEEPYGTRRPVS